MAYFAKFAVRWVFADGGSGAWTWHMIGTGGVTWSDVELETIAQLTLNWWVSDSPDEDHLSGGAPRNFYPNGYRLLGCEGQRITPPEGDQLFFEWSPPAEGLSGEIFAMYPPQVATVIGLRTDVNTRRYRGRMYWPAGLPPSPSDSGELLEPERKNLADMVWLLHQQFENNQPGDGAWAMCVYSRVDGDGHTVTHFAIPNRLGTQRRRRLQPDEYTLMNLGGEIIDPPG